MEELPVQIMSRFAVDTHVATGSQPWGVAIKVNLPNYRKLCGRYIYEQDNMVLGDNEVLIFKSSLAL